MLKMLKDNRDLLCKIFVISGIFGFIYEEIFYYFDLGYFVKRGSTFGPWIPIYAFGGVMIYLGCNKLKNKPLYIFLLASVIAGVLEFLIGYYLWHFRSLRLWDYNTEMLNFGNIGGYVCLRSVLFFGISGLLLFYVILPAINKINVKFNNSINKYVTNILFCLFVIDIIISWIIVK